jgi:plasmid stabilization system protein ParE
MDDQGDRSSRGDLQLSAQQSEYYARRLVDRLVGRADMLGDFPEMGRLVPELQDLRTRELIVSPYRVIYRIEHGEVQILAFVHGRQDSLDDLA